MMYLSNTAKIKGKELGLVVGSYVATRNFYKNWFNGVRNFFGWELKSYTEMNEDAIDAAINRMVERAEAKGADAVVNIRITGDSLVNDAAVIIVSGTAMKRA